MTRRTRVSDQTEPPPHVDAPAIDYGSVPWSQDAEQSVLGGLLLDNQAYDRVGDLLTGEEFFVHAHATIYRVIAALITASKPADVITVHEECKALSKAHRGEPVELSYLNALSQSVPSAHNARRYAEIVREHYLSRTLLAKLDEATGVARGPGSFDLKLDTVASSISALERNSTSNLAVDMGTVIVELLDHINDLAANGLAPGWSTRFPTLDRYLRGGFHAGRMYLLGGRPGMGKSALALWWETKCSVEEGIVSLYLSQEMPRREVGERSVASVGRISYERLQVGELQDQEWGRLSEAAEKLRRAPFYVDEQAGLSGNEIRLKCRQIKGLNLVVIDYIQLCRGTGEGEANRNAELELISRAVKTLAKQLKVAVIVLSALNRRVDDRPHGRAILADFKDCSALEADADVVMSLFQVKTLEATDCVLIGLDVLKNRQGRKGSLVLNFWGDQMSWGESEYELEELLKPDRKKKGDDL